MPPQPFMVAALVVLASATSATSAGAFPDGVSALDVVVHGEPSHRPEDWGCGPSRVLLSMTSSAIHVGEEARDVLAHATVAAAAGHLRRLKDARPDRTELVIEVADDVSFERLVRVVDAARGLDYRAVSLVLERGGARFEDFGWRPPPPRREQIWLPWSDPPYVDRFDVRSRSWR